MERGFGVTSRTRPTFPCWRFHANGEVRWRARTRNRERLVGVGRDHAQGGRISNRARLADDRRDDGQRDERSPIGADEMRVAALADEPGKAVAAAQDGGAASDAASSRLCEAFSCACLKR